MSKTKTKNVSRRGLSASILRIRAERDPANWLLPIFIPGDALKSLNAVKTSLYRFDSAKLPDRERERAWFTLVRCAARSWHQD